MSTFSTCTSTLRPTSPTDGDVLFETDTKNVIIWDGTNWRGYQNDAFALGPNTYSVDFDGTDDRVEIGNATVLNSASAFSWSLWIKSSMTVTTTADLFSSGDGFYNGISFYANASSFDFLIGGGGSSYSGIRYGSSVFDGTWKHLAGTYNGSSFALYIDGSLATTSSIGGAVPSSTVSTAGNGSHIASRVNDTREYLGKMDDFAIFNSALTASEVSNIYSGNFYPTTKLSHLYKFENNYNDSIGSLNGTAQGDPTFDASDKPY